MVHFAIFERFRRPWLYAIALGMGVMFAPAGWGLVVAERPMSPADLDQLRVALDAYDGGQATMAEPILRRLVRSYPESYPALEALGGLLVESGRTAEAVPLLKRAVASAPGEVLGHANLGAAYLALGRTHEAAGELRAATEAPGADAQAFANLGQALLQDAQPAEAAKAYERAATLAAPGTDLVYNWALSLDRAGETGAAAEVLGRLAPAQRNDETDVLAGEVDERLGRFQSALVHLQAAVRENPSDGNLYALVLELLRHWTWDAAIQVSQFAQTRYPKSLHFRTAEGIARYAANDYKGAVPIFAALLQQQPDNAMMADLLGKSCLPLSEGEESGGCDGVYAFARAHPGNAVLTTYAAVAILHRPVALQDLTEARTLLGAAIRADPKFAPAYFQMGVLEQLQLRWRESIPVLEQAAALEPKSPDTHYRLSRAYAHLGMREAAQKQLELRERYAQEAKASLDAKLGEVETFLLHTR